MILVTGATGYVGRRIVQALAGAGHGVRCLVRASSDASILEGMGVEVHLGDVTDPASLESACQGADAVVHTVAIIREKGSYTFDRVNHLGTRNVVEAARNAGARRLVHLSAIGARPEPRYLYLYSKWRGEEAVAQGGLPYVIFRPSIIFGPGDEFINALAAAVKLSPVTPILGSGKARFQPIHVEEVARCVASAVEDDRYLNRIIEIGGPERVTYREIVDRIIEALGCRRIKVSVPVFPLRLVAPILGRLLPHFPITGTELSMLNLDNVAEVDSVPREFGFQPRPLEGNMRYILDMSWREAFAISLGLRPARRW